MKDALLDMELSLRGLLRNFGLKLGAVSKGRWEARVRELIAGNAMLEAAAELIRQIDARFDRMDERLYRMEGEADTLIMGLAAQRRSRRSRLHQRGDRLPDPFGGPLDVPVTEMGVAQRHAGAGMTEQAGDHRHRHPVHHRVAGVGVAKVMNSHVLQLGARGCGARGAGDR